MAALDERSVFRAIAPGEADFICQKTDSSYSIILSC